MFLLFLKTLPKLGIPVTIVPAIEHFDDIYVISGVVGKPFFEDPGMYRTLTGDDFATSLGGLIGVLDILFIVFNL